MLNDVGVFITFLVLMITPQLLYVEFEIIIVFLRITFP